MTATIEPTARVCPAVDAAKKAVLVPLKEHRQESFTPGDYQCLDGIMELTTEEVIARINDSERAQTFRIMDEAAGRYGKLIDARPLLWLGPYASDPVSKSADPAIARMLVAYAVWRLNVFERPTPDPDHISMRDLMLYVYPFSIHSPLTLQDVRDRQGGGSGASGSGGTAAAATSVSAAQQSRSGASGSGEAVEKLLDSPEVAEWLREGGY